MAKQVIHRHSIGSMPASLNSGHGSIGPMFGTSHGSSVTRRTTWYSPCAA
jgi:hypothetical protein